jgi:DNA-binding MarR family transcriptional regulator
MYIHLLSMNPSPLPVLPCMCANLRRTARALTQLYEEALAPADLRATQFTVLQALSLTGEVSQGRLGQILVMDSTTLTRTLEILIRHGWIAKRPGKDRRERRLQLAKPGLAKLERALPYWHKAQAKLRAQLGNERWDALFSLTNEVTSAVTE